MPKRTRLAWFAAVAFVGAMGIGSLAIWAIESMEGPGWWGIDLRLVIDAAGRLADAGSIYADPKYLYPPLAALAAVPLARLDPVAVSLGYAALKIGLAAACVAMLTRDWRPADRALAAIGVMTCLPFLHDLFLGNANAVIVASMVPAVYGRDRMRNGILLGVVAAAFAKPLIIPVLVWLLVWRRGAFTGAVFAGVAASIAALAIVGPGAYAGWLTAMSSGLSLAMPFAGNHGVSAVLPSLWQPVALATAVCLVLVLWRRGPRTGLAWAVASGILMAPYAGTYAALPMALALPTIGPLMPTFALALVATSPVATAYPLPLYAAAVLIGSLALQEHTRAGRPGRVDVSGDRI